MKFEHFYISNSQGNSNCVVRSLCKVLKKEYEEVCNDLLKTAKKMNYDSFNDIHVFEKYMEENGVFRINIKEDIVVKNLELDKGLYIVLCYDKKDYYHMFSVINNTIYDKNNNCMNLFVLAIYKKNKKM